MAGLGGGQPLEVALDLIIGEPVVFPDQEIEQVREEDVLVDPGLVEERVVPAQVTAVRRQRVRREPTLDREVVDWFKSNGRHYQSRMNAVLKAYAKAHQKPASNRRDGARGGT